MVEITKNQNISFHNLGLSEDQLETLEAILERGVVLCSMLKEGEIENINSTIKSTSQELYKDGNTVKIREINLTPSGAGELQQRVREKTGDTLNYNSLREHYFSLRRKGFFGDNIPKKARDIQGGKTWSKGHILLFQELLYQRGKQENYTSVNRGNIKKIHKQKKQWGVQLYTFIPYMIVEMDSYDSIDEFIKKYTGNKGQIKFAKDLKISHLLPLSTAVSALGLREKLGWSYINLPVKVFEDIETKLGKDGAIEEYKRNEGQIQFAKDLKISHLLQLSTAISALGLREKLGWSQINLSVKVFEDIETKLGKDGAIEEYKRNEGQVQFAKELNISQLGQFYTAVSALGLTNKLGWSYINLTVKVFENIETILGEDGAIEKYTGNKGQIQFAKDLEISHLGYLSTAISALGLVEKLGWSYINLPVKVFGNIEKTLSEEGAIEKYTGNEGQIQFAKDLKISHLGHLYTAVSALGLTKELGWSQINLPVKVFEDIEATLGKDVLYFLISKSINILFIHRQFSGKQDLFQKLFNGIDVNILENITKEDISFGRLIRYIFSELNSENLEHFQELLQSKEARKEIRERIDEILSEEMQVFLRTYAETRGEMATSQDAMGRSIPYEDSIHGEGGIVDSHSPDGLSELIRIDNEELWREFYRLVGEDIGKKIKKGEITKELMQEIRNIEGAYEILEKIKNIDTV